MKQPLKSVLIDRFDEIELNESELVQIAQTRSAKNFINSTSLVRRLLACCVVVLALIFCHDAYQTYRTHNLLNAIAVEMVDNHLKQKPLEVRSADLPSVLQYFTELDFSLLSIPNIAKEDGKLLLGARYCSIQGVTAAQFRVRHSDGSVESWYQGVLPDKQLNLIPDLQRGEKESVHNIRGAKATIWRNKGVVFVTVVDHN